MRDQRSEVAGITQAARERLERWRAQHGGRGRRIPRALWDEAVELARRNGIKPTARALGLNAQSLQRRVTQLPAEAETIESGFVEISGADLRGPGINTIEWINSAGERLRIEVAGPLDVLSLVQAFASQR